MNDPYTLQRFVDAQANVWAEVNEELRSGKKRSHWMWFIFPQIAGLGHSETARHFAIRSMEEARAYLRHPVLGPRLAECTRMVIALHKTQPSPSALDIFGSPDNLKFHSSMTLFSQADSSQPEFAAALMLYFDNVPDRATLERLATPANLSSRP